MQLSFLGHQKGTTKGSKQQPGGYKQKQSYHIQVTQVTTTTAIQLTATKSAIQPSTDKQTRPQ